MAESSLWKYLRKNMQGYGHWIRVENAVELGTPDVNGCCQYQGKSIDVWIELKAIDEWPKRATTRVKLKRFTDEQKQWLIDRRKAGGKAFLFIRVGREYFLFKPGIAYHIENMTQAQWRKHAHFFAIGSIDWDSFRRSLWR